MDLTPHIAALQHQFLLSAAASGDDAQELAERLLPPLEAATRLTLLDALSAASEEITSELAPGSVDARLRGRDLEFVVVSPGEVTASYQSDEDARPTEATANAGTGPEVPGPVDDGNAVRTTLRIPEAMKARAELAAAAAGISLNTWLIRSIGATLDPAPTPPRVDKPGRNRFTGWVS